MAIAATALIAGEACSLLVDTGGLVDPGGAAGVGGDGGAGSEALFDEAHGDGAPEPDGPPGDGPAGVDGDLPDGALVGDGGALVAYVPFDEGQGTVADDVTGHGHYVGLVNDAGWVQGAKNTAMRVSGSSIGRVAKLDGPDFPQASGTLSFWVRSDPFAVGNVFDGFASSRAHIFIEVSDALPNAYHLAFADPTAERYYACESDLQTMDITVWNHLAVTWSSGSVMWTVNGGVPRTAAYPSTWRPAAQVSQFGFVFGGAIDELRVYAAAMDAASLRAIP